MRFGKVELQEDRILYNRLGRRYEISLKEILWAYHRVEEASAKLCCGRVPFEIHSVVLVTGEKKTLPCPMSGEEAQGFLAQISRQNPRIAVGCPKGCRIALSSLPNTRDLGGIATKDGYRILPRRLIRSGQLSDISPEDAKTLLEEYNLKTIVDFRTDTEREEQPDPVLEGVRYIVNPVAKEETIGITRERKGFLDLLELNGDSKELMRAIYPSLVRDKFSREQYQRFFDCLLAQEEGAVLWHCSAGKDRVGVGTMLLLSAFNVPEDVIRRDYIRTRGYLRETNETLIARLAEQTGAPEEKLEQVRIIFETEEEYLDSVFAFLKREYGTVKAYLRKELDLTEDKLQKLRELYLCKG